MYHDLNISMPQCAAIVIPTCFQKDSSQRLDFRGTLASQMRFISLKHGGWIQYLCCGTLELNPMGAAALPHHSSSLGLLFSNFPDHAGPECSHSVHVFRTEDYLTWFLMKLYVSVPLPANIVSLSLSRRVIFKITLGFHYHLHFFFPVTTWLPRTLSAQPRCRHPHETTSCHIWTDFSS